LASSKKKRRKSVLLNPQQSLPVLPGSRMLSDCLGLVGVLIEDPCQPGRRWTICNLFAPIKGRFLGGVRAKLQDEKGFISFINQRDLELLLDIAKPGDWCPYLDTKYPYINDEEDGWFGICCDAEDLVDDLYERELLLRQQYGGIIPSHVEVSRRVHHDDNKEEEELLLFLWDKDPETNYSPDPRLDTLMRRWTTVERTRIKWSRVLANQ
jgi:hypothetical protein